MLGWSSTTRIRAGRRAGHKLTIFCSEPASAWEVARPSGLTAERESWNSLIGTLFRNFVSACTILPQSHTRCAAQGAIAHKTRSESGRPTSEPAWTKLAPPVTSNLVSQRLSCLLSAMIFSPSRLRKPVLLFVLVLLNQSSAVAAASKPHILTFGKWATIQCSPDSAGTSEGEKPLTLRVRPLLVDARVKEFTFGAPHDVTDRLFVVRRAFRLNDSLPHEPASSPPWQW